MNRRRFFSLVAGALVAPLAAGKAMAAWRPKPAPQPWDGHPGLDPNLSGISATGKWRATSVAKVRPDAVIVHFQREQEIRFDGVWYYPVGGSVWHDDPPT